MTVAGTRRVREEWVRLLGELRDREGTIVDVTADMMAFEDQRALSAVRDTPLEVRTNHLFLVLQGLSAWPATLSVEGWLRQALASVASVERLAVLMLWGVVVAKAVGPEGIREVALAAESWKRLDMCKLGCSGRSDSVVAKAAHLQASAIEAAQWSRVLLAVDRASVECFWDWRRATMECCVHPKIDCPHHGWLAPGIILPDSYMEEDWVSVERASADLSDDGRGDAEKQNGSWDS